MATPFQPGKVIESNIELAKAYSQVAAAASVGGSTSNFPNQRKAICSSQVDIQAHFAEHGSLENLNVPGIGEGIKRVLSMILRDGVQSSLNHARENREQATRLWQRGIADKIQRDEMEREAEGSFSDEDLFGDPE